MKKIIFSVISAFIIFLVGVGLFSPGFMAWVKAGEAFNDGVVAYAVQGDYENALAYFDRAILINPDFSRAFYKRGQLYIQIGEYEEAIRDFNRALKTAPDMPEAHNGLGIAWYHMGEHEKADAAFKNALRIKPDLEKAYLYQGHICFDRSDYKEAMKYYSRAIKIKNRYIKAYLGRGCAYSKWEKLSLGDDRKHKQAVKDYKKAFRLGGKEIRLPDDATAYYIRAGLTSGLEDMWEDQRIADYTKAIEIDPTFARAYLDRADIYFEKIDGNSFYKLENYEAEVYKELALSDYDRAFFEIAKYSGTIGIGRNLFIDEKTSTLSVGDIINNSPALHAGILKGDKIVEIDGISTNGIKLNEAVKWIRGEPNTPVILKICRNGECELKKIVREPTNPLMAEICHNRGMLFEKMCDNKMAFLNFNLAAAIYSILKKKDDYERVKERIRSLESE